MSDNYELNDGEIPVFLINGFLDSGKTDFIKYTMSQDYFQSDGNTLLILCEEGESEYSEAELKKYKTKIVRFEKETEFNKKNLSEIERIYSPERIIIEWNGLWKQDDLYDGPMSEKILSKNQGRDAQYEISMPESWVIYQVITIMDGESLGPYISNNNFRGYLGQMLRNAELAIINRCDNVPKETLSDYRRKIRAMGQNAMIILEGKDGEIPQDMLPEDLPYSLDAPHIDVNDQDYGIWFMDMMDNPDRYQGKTVSFRAMVLKRQGMKSDECVPGRMAVTCCSDDMTFLGFVTRMNPRIISRLKTRDWVYIKAEVRYEERDEYGGEGPVLYAQEVEPAEEIKEPVTF